jgi:hypothetical protein
MHVTTTNRRDALAHADQAHSTAAYKAITLVTTVERGASAIRNQGAVAVALKSSRSRSTSLVFQIFRTSSAMSQRSLPAKLLGVPQEHNADKYNCRTL